MSAEASRTFVPLQVAVLSVSDTRTFDTDSSGALLSERVAAAGHRLADRRIVRDEITSIRDSVAGWIADQAIDVVVTTGGTGLTGRDVTPEAVAPLFEKVIEGFAVIFHQVSFDSVGLSTLQSRACAGVAGGTIIFCLPGSNGAVRDGWDKVIAPLLDARHQPCNLVEVLPRLTEA
jgi:molybdenum cofactor biosynthesis protein B